MSLMLENASVTDEIKTKKGNVRWWMLGLFLFGVTVNYITRNSLGILAPELKTTLGMSTEQYSWIVGSFQLAYTIFQPLCGWLIDVIGLKVGFLICATIWAFVTMLHAGAGSWLHLAILRFLMGATEAAATPANAKTLGEWFPKKRTPRCRRLGGRRFLSWRDVSAADYRDGTLLARLARRIHFLGYH